MRGLIKGISALFIVSLLLAFLHSCSLDNGILKPSCLVFEIDLNENWWYPKENSYKPLYFRSNGLVVVEGQTDSLAFVLQNCNKLVVTNYTTHTEEQWVIKRITDVDLNLQYPDGELVMYTRQK